MTDAHAPLRRNILPDDLRPLLAYAGVDRTVLVEAHGSLEETDWFLELADANDFIAGVVAWVDLLAPGLDERLDRYARNPKFRGVRHKVHDEPDPDWLVRPGVLGALRQLENRGIPYDLLVRTEHLKHVPAVAESCPDLRMVIDHIAKPRIAEGGNLHEWSRAIRAAAAIPTLRCKLSGMVTEADWAAWRPDDLKPYIAVVVEAFGFKRLMFGSDWPVCELASGYQDVLDALQYCVGGLTGADRDALYWRTAAQFYNLEVGNR